LSYCHFFVIPGLAQSSDVCTEILYCNFHWTAYSNAF